MGLITIEGFIQMACDHVIDEDKKEKALLASEIVIGVSKLSRQTNKPKVICNAYDLFVFMSQSIHFSGEFTEDDVFANIAMMNVEI